MSNQRYPEEFKNPGGQPSNRKTASCFRGGCAIGRAHAQPLCLDYPLHQTTGAAGSER